MLPLRSAKPFLRARTGESVAWPYGQPSNLEQEGNKRDQLATIKKLLALALAIHPNTPPEEAASADAKAVELLAAYAEGLSGTDAAADANWDNAA